MLSKDRGGLYPVYNDRGKRKATIVKNFKNHPSSNP